MVLADLEVLNGSLSVIVSVISICSGCLIISKYFKYKNKTLLYVGISGILMFGSWWPSAISFLLALITGDGLSLEMYLLIGNTPVPIAIIFWLFAFTRLLYKDKKKLILGTFIVIGVLFEFFLYYFIFTDPTTIGQLQGYVDIEYNN